MRMKIILAIIVISCVLSSCSGNGAESNLESSSNNGGSQESVESLEALYRRISPEEAKSKMGEGEQLFVLLDVRTEDEFEGGHIEGAILIPDFEIESRAGEELPDKDVIILIYCRTGRRSELVARQLIEMGYVHVYDFGGIYDWPFETVQ